MRQVAILVLSLFLLICCTTKNNKNECILNEIEVGFLQKYLIEIDTCINYKNFPKTKYYNDDRLLMSGFSRRNEKQGNWFFFSKKRRDSLRVFFENSQPKSVSVFKELDSISWKIYNNRKEEYLISIPDSWILIDDNENNKVGILDKSVLSYPDAYNFKLIITSLKLEDLDESVKSLYESSIDLFKKNKFENLESKEINIDTFNEVYEIIYEELMDNGIRYVNREVFYSYKDRFYLLSFSKRNDISYDYSIIEEILDTSFKIYRN